MTSPPSRLAATLDRTLHAPAVRSLGRAAGELAGLVLPADCAVCGVRDGSVCPDCAPELTASLLHPYRAEGDAAALPLVPGATEEDLRPLPVVAAGRYGGALARALLAFKDHGRTPVAGILRPAVHRALVAAPGLLSAVPGAGASVSRASPALLVPVPGSAAGFRRRGYDPVAELVSGPLPPGWRLAPGLLRAAPGGGAAQAWRTVVDRGLRGVPGTGASHAGSAAHHRRRRGTGRFRAAGRPAPARGRAIVVLDDVMTTGSTLAAAWRALDAGGLTPCAAVVLAAVTAPGTPAGGGLNSA